jgi:hypothetical protein
MTSRQSFSPAGLILTRIVETTEGLRALGLDRNVVLDLAAVLAHTHLPGKGPAQARSYLADTAEQDSDAAYLEAEDALVKQSTVGINGGADFTAADRILHGGGKSMPTSKNTGTGTT